jgi:thiol-disulfide isomerase/thioredoxin
MDKQLLIENIRSGGKIALFFSAGHCHACKKVKPLIEKIIKNNPNYIYENVIEGQPEAESLNSFCNIEYYPTLLILEDKREIKKYIGYDQIKKLYESYPIH